MLVCAFGQIFLAISFHQSLTMPVLSTRSALAATCSLSITNRSEISVHKDKCHQYLLPWPHLHSLDYDCPFKSPFRQATPVDLILLDIAPTAVPSFLDLSLPLQMCPSSLSLQKKNQPQKQTFNSLVPPSFSLCPYCACPDWVA